MRNFAIASLALAIPTMCLGQSNVLPTQKYCWGENLGWQDWLAAGPEGARYNARYLSGFVWCETAGWVNLGRGPQPGRYEYADPSHQSDQDFGVNVDPSTGNLSGFAWGENIGWINFGGGADSWVAIDATGRARGNAWGENSGWIAFQADAQVPGLAMCYANCDGSTTAPILNINDFQCFLNKFAQGDMYANSDGSTVAPVLNVNDFQMFLNRFAAGCS